MAGYAARPALGWRARSLTTDPAAGRTTAALLPRFDTITCRDLWANVRAISTAWRHDAVNPAAPGDFVATVAPNEAFREAVQTAKIAADKDIPHLSASMIAKYVADLQLLGLV